jgi:atlastin
MLINGQFLEGNMNPFPKAVGGGGTPQASCSTVAPTAPRDTRRARAPLVAPVRAAAHWPPRCPVVRKGAESGFSWRGGRERNTTGIWLWGEVFMRQLPETGEEVAVLLMDTQGMFDSRLTQMLTACIFGLSTLISSHQIYNVQNRIQEDNLQHLALFTEYGRIAHSKQREAEAEEGQEGGGAAPAPAPAPASAAFQRLEFLVRDWQEYEGLEEDELRGKVAEMDTYLHEVLETESREHKDLRDVREHIHECFDDVGAFLLPHPGFEVVNPNFDGDVEKIRKPFRTLCESLSTHRCCT